LIFFVNNENRTKNTPIKSPAATKSSFNNPSAMATAAIAKLSVPKSMTTYHLAVLNSTSRMQYLTENMLQVNENPLLALTSARMFGKEGAHFIEAMTVVNNSLANQGIFADEVAGKKLYVNTTEL